MGDLLDLWLAEVAAVPAPDARPAVTLTYAQTLDGSLATSERGTLLLSSPASLRWTHRLRAAHDAILVGVGTVLADNPRLTVRLVEGPDPRPIVLDSDLRTPPGAQLLRGPQSAWIVCAGDAPAERRRPLESAGAQLLEVPRGPDGRLDLPAVLATLKAQGIQRVMVEGGAEVIASFLRAGTVDTVLLTIAPRWASGLPAVQADGLGLRLEGARWLALDPDGIVIGRLAGGAS